MIDLTVKVLAVSSSLALVLQLRVRPALLWSIAAVLAVLFVVQLVLASQVPVFNFDYYIFCRVGRDVWAGRDPYAADNFAVHPFLNPPTALPLFTLFTALPPRVSGALWTAGNALACLLLVALARQALWNRTSGTAPAAAEASGDSPAALAVLTVVLATSDAALANFYTGQLGVLEAFALLMALRARNQERSVQAGGWLALATVKAVTLMPFLLLFCRRYDRRTWLALAGGVAGLCLLATSPAELPGRLSSLVHHIAELSAPGQVNDYSFQGTQHWNLLGFDHALYCLGLRDRRLIQVGQFSLVAALGVWVAACVLGRRRLPWAAAGSLAALYSLVFFYHRHYDAVILVLPLTYCAGQVGSASGTTRWLFIAAAGSMLTVLFVSRDFLSAALAFAHDRGILGWVVQAAVLPWATWAIVLTMFLLAAAARRTSSSSGTQLAA